MYYSTPYKVAVVDDDQDQLNYVKKLIKRDSRFEVLEFDNPLNAIEEIRNQKIKIVFTDINMPEMYGDDLLRELMKEKKGVQVFVHTSEPKLTIFNSCINNGARGCMQKPIDISLMQNCLDEAANYMVRCNEVFGKVSSSAA